MSDDRVISETIPHPEIPRSWNLKGGGDGEDLVMALVGLFGGKPAIIDRRFIAWIPPEPPPPELIALLSTIRDRNS